jgi:hypothetical protein
MVSIYGILFQAALLTVALYMVARKDADLEFPKIALVVAGITFGNLILQWALFAVLGYFVILLQFSLDAFILMRFCYVSLKQAVMTLVIVIACNFAWALMISY